MLEYVNWGVGILGTGVGIFLAGYKVCQGRNGYIKRQEYNLFINAHSQQHSVLHEKINDVAKIVSHIEGIIEGKLNE